VQQPKIKPLLNPGVFKKDLGCAREQKRGKTENKTDKWRIINTLCIFLANLNDF
jgi:hypothetical protein